LVLARANIHRLGQVAQVAVLESDTAVRGASRWRAVRPNKSQVRTPRSPE